MQESFWWCHCSDRYLPLPPSPYPAPPPLLPVPNKPYVFCGRKAPCLFAYHIPSTPSLRRVRLVVLISVVVVVVVIVIVDSIYIALFSEIIFDFLREIGVCYKINIKCDKEMFV